MPPNIMISGVRPKTLPVIHVTPHYKNKKNCIHLAGGYWEVSLRKTRSVR